MDRRTFLKLFSAIVAGSALAPQLSASLIDGAKKSKDIRNFCPEVYAHDFFDAHIEVKLSNLVDRDSFVDVYIEPIIQGCTETQRNFIGTIYEECDSAIFSISSSFGGCMPERFRIIVENNSLTEITLSEANLNIIGVFCDNDGNMTTKKIAMNSLAFKY